jgi:hypothetical protein
MSAEAPISVSVIDLVAGYIRFSDELIDESRKSGLKRSRGSDAGKDECMAGSKYAKGMKGYVNGS